MTIHKEGYRSILYAAIFVIVVNTIVFELFPDSDLYRVLSLLITLPIFLIILQFFRLPYRKVVRNDAMIFAPCDGKVVVIEQVMENEYFKDKRIQISIFMSPINVHANWYPLGGVVRYVKYHKGKYLVAWDPKSSTENERSTLVVEKENRVSILFRQVAGALAKRIVYYPQVGDIVKQGAEFGFIKFGSRVDIYLPLDAKIKVKIGDKSTGGITTIAELA